MFSAHFPDRSTNTDFQEIYSTQYCLKYISTWEFLFGVYIFSQFNSKISNLSIYWLLTFETFVLSFRMHVYKHNDFGGLRYLRGSCKHHNTTLLNISGVSSQNKNIVLYYHNTTIKLKKFNIVTILLFNKQPI